MKKTALILCLALLTCSEAIAQDAFFPITFTPGDTIAVFGDKINVRSQPSTDAPNVTQLLAGERVIIREVQSQQSTVNGLNMPWYSVRILKDGSNGFIWGGLLSAMPAASIDGVDFVAGITKMTRKPQNENVDYQVEVRAIRDNAVLSRASTTIQNSGGFIYRPFEPGARGLKGYSALICVGMGYEACGYPWIDWYLLWNGKQLQALPLCTSVAEAGLFAHIETYVFPQGEDEFSPGHHFGEEHFYYSVEHHETDEKENNAGFNENSWKRARKMNWDGKQWSKPKNMEIPKQ
jgi:uncharacterized protein YraI